MLTSTTHPQIRYNQEIFDDRLEISNPGGLPSGLTPQTFGTKSVVRNPIIASLLHRTSYIEKIGTGIKRIKNAVKKFGRGKVSFTFNSFFNVSFSRVKSQEKTAPEIEQTTQETTQETNREIIIRLIKTNPTITDKELADKTGLTTDGVKYHLNKLREQGVIKNVGGYKERLLGNYKGQ